MLNKPLILIASFFLFSYYIVYSQQSIKLELHDVISSSLFRPKAVDEIRSMNDGVHYTSLQDRKHIVRFRYAEGLATDTLFSANLNLQPSVPYITDYMFNSDESKILLTSNEEPIYRYSFTADYYVYDLRNRKLKRISKLDKLQLATFSPTGNQVAFVRENNLYIADIQTGKEIQVTTDGKHNEIINGAPDWVYEEEFGFSKGFEWSPDGKKIAFMKFDESKVKTITIPFYNDLYPTLYTYKYPKAGEENSVVNIYVYDLASGKVRIMDAGKEEDQYIPRIKWTADPDKLAIIRLNRHQNKVDILFADAATGKSKNIYSETNKYFISGIDDQFITFLNDAKHFVVFSERSGYKHLYMYSVDGKLENPVTAGNYDVDKLLGIDETNRILYYSSTEMSPLDRDIFSISLSGVNKTKLLSGKGTHRAEFSSNYQYFIDNWSDANTPPVTSLYKVGGELIRTLENNAFVASEIKEYGFAQKDFISIPSADNMLLNAYIIKPADFNPGKKYPVLMTVYGGPESQEVTNEWDTQMGWYQFLAQQGIIIVCTDNRGTDGRGEAFRKSTYMQLGRLETEDQINVAKYLATLPYVDGNRIGIFGWSYGGYMSALCMTQGAEFFRLGIAVAPVTNWRFYDSVYTERFMRTPQENPSGYDDNSPINHAEKLKGKLLLIHGSADDNVHLQNTMEFAEKLIQANKNFDMAIYPDKNHGIYGGNTRMHLYQKMTDFLLQNL